MLIGDNIFFCPPAPSSLSTNHLAEEEEEEAGSIVVMIGGVVQPQREPCCTAVCKCCVMLYDSYVHAGIDTWGGGGRGGTRIHLRAPIFQLPESCIIP